MWFSPTVSNGIVLSAVPMFQVIRGKVPSKISGLIPTSLSIVHDKLQTSGVGKAQHQPVLASEST